MEKHFLLIYVLPSDFLERRAQHRRAHLEEVWASEARGHLQLAGSLTDPSDYALLLFKADDKSIVEEFARNDPYVLNGLVTAWHIREWLTVAGDTAISRIRPD